MISKKNIIFILSILPLIGLLIFILLLFIIPVLETNVPFWSDDLYLSSFLIFMVTLFPILSIVSLIYSIKNIRNRKKGLSSKPTLILSIINIIILALMIIGFIWGGTIYVHPIYEPSLQDIIDRKCVDTLISGICDLNSNELIITNRGSFKVHR